jgi:predicted HicB family RNase H-like nuclease
MSRYLGPRTRITLRIPYHLSSSLKHLARFKGVSVNELIIATLKTAKPTVKPQGAAQ